MKMLTVLQTVKITEIAKIAKKTMSSAVEKEVATGNYVESRRIREMHTYPSIL